MSGNDNKDSFTQRAGTYVHQVTGYRAFIPRPLPPTPPIRFDDEMLDLLTKATLALGRLDGTSELLPDADLFVAMYVNKEAVLSSQIEGTQASLIDVLSFEANAAEPENPQDIEEVVNYVDALNYGLRRLETLPLSLRLIREIHARLLAGGRGAEKRPGEFRSSQNWIGHVGSTIKTAQFVPPPVTDMNQALGDIERFIYNDAPMPILIKIGLVHAQFETIHPFLDGNGRMGRLLITFILCQQGILRLPLLYLSYYFKQHKPEYYEYLQLVREAGEWEAWLKFFLCGVREVADGAASTARQIVRLREQHRALIASQFQRASGVAANFLEQLYRRPIVTVNGVVLLTGQTYANANNLVSRFEQMGILSKMTPAGRNRRFAYDEYLAMFTDEATLALSSSLPDGNAPE